MYCLELVFPDKSRLLRYVKKDISAAQIENFIPVIEKFLGLPVLNWRLCSVEISNGRLLNDTKKYLEV